MIECAKDVFYRSISGPENIHPTCERERCVWKDQATGNVVGISTPGYLTGGGAIPLLAEHDICREERRGAGAQP